MDWKLEVVVVPVMDVERAKRFYSEQVGFVVDHDTRVSDEVRIVQLTPRGSGCSIVVGSGLTDMAPGSLQGLQLVVADVEAARAELAARDARRVDPAARTGRRRRRSRLRRLARARPGRRARI